MDKKLTAYEQEVQEYFKNKAKDYDDVDQQTYWILSDKLLWSLLALHIPKHKQLRVLDAGGGTGRWSKKILLAYPHADVTLVDFSSDMLEEAKKKNDFGDRWQFVHANIKQLPFSDNIFDIVLNTHNVLGFVDDHKAALTEMCRVLAGGGKIISVVPNKYHGIFFNLKMANVKGAMNILHNSRGRFVDGMPEIDFFSPQYLVKEYEHRGLHDIKTFGFPVTIYPGYHETQLHGQSKDVVDILQTSFDDVFLLESELVRDENLAPRGNNLCIIGSKRWNPP